MTRARRELVDLSATSYYHCISRCVRRAFLCGNDNFSGKNYEHRKSWVVDRLTELAPVFAIEVCAFAIMSNHYHLVLRVDKESATNLTDEAVIQRWQQLFKLPALIVRFQNQQTDPAENNVAQKIIQQWRERLMDLSWYMRMLNEYLARKANAEDNCTGRFWEGRYKSQALLDDAAVLTCMSYVDLNPIRAAMADSLDTSDYTSIQQRIFQWQSEQKRDESQTFNSKSENQDNKLPLMPLIKTSDDKHMHAIGYLTEDYFELVDWAGRCIREGKRGFIPETTSPILDHLGLDPDSFIQHMQGKKPHLTVTHALGKIDKLQAYAKQLGIKFIKFDIDLI